MSNAVLFFGRFHPLIVHLPIGFLTLLAVVELANRVHRFKHAAQARGVILFATALSSVAAVVFGLMLASGGGYDRGLLFWHQWMGITLAACVIATAVSFRFGRHRLYSGLLLLTLAVMAPASHFGGSITHGKNFLTAYAPTWLGGPPQLNFVVQKTAIADPMQAVLFTDLVQPEIAQNCIACHGAAKSAGQLRLDSYPAIVQGGNTGPAVVVGDSNNSLLLQRVLLPADHPRRMPAGGRPALTEDQIEILRWWIDAGATEHQTVAQTHPSAVRIALTSRVLKLPLPLKADVPLSVPDITAQMSAASARTGAVVAFVVADEPWVATNAAVARSFGDTELAALRSLGANLTILNLAGTNVTDAGLASIAKFPNLRELRLDRTAVTDAGLKHLSNLDHLETLNLYSTAVTDAGLVTLKHLRVLKRLYIWKTKIAPAAGQQFAEEKTDHAAIDRLQHQIADLRSQIISKQIEVVGAASPTTAPSSVVAK